MRQRAKNLRKFSGLLVLLLLTVLVIPTAAQADTDATARKGELTASGARIYDGTFVTSWTDPCPEGKWKNADRGLAISISGENEDGEKTSTGIAIDFEGFKPNFSIERDVGASGPGTGIGIINETVEINGGEYTVWTNENCPWGQEVSFVPASAAQLLPDFQALAQDILPEPELTLQPFDKDKGWTYVNVPIDFRTTPESVEPVIVTIDSGGPEPVWVTITAIPTTLTYKSGDPLVAGDKAQKSCPVEPHATADYVDSQPGECSYQYTNASSVANGSVFEAKLELDWTVTYESSDGPGTLTVDPTVQEEDVAVAEIKVVNVPSKK